MNSINRIAIALACIFLLISCQNEKGYPVTPQVKNPNNQPEPNSVQQQSSTVVANYAKIENLPADGTRKISQFRASFGIVPNISCVYEVTEVIKLKLSGKEIVLDIVYKQNLQDGPDKNQCPQAHPSLRNHLDPKPFEEYSKDKINSFLIFSNPEFVGIRFSWVKKAELLQMESVKFKELNTVHIQMKLFDRDGKVFLLEAYFEKENPFLGLMDFDVTDVSNSKSIDSRKFLGLE